MYMKQRADTEISATEEMKNIKGPQNALYKGNIYMRQHAHTRISATQGIENI